jgi:hypothetical protein
MTRSRGCWSAWLTIAVLGAALIAVRIVPAHADAITEENVTAAVLAAKTPADHQALAAYFTSKAEAAQAEVEKHQQMAKGFSGKAQARMAEHCDALAKTFRQQATDYTALAKEQTNLAK